MCVLSAVFLLLFLLVFIYLLLLLLLVCVLCVVFWGIVFCYCSYSTSSISSSSSSSSSLSSCCCCCSRGFIELLDKWPLGCITSNIDDFIKVTEAAFQTTGPVYLHAVWYLPFRNSPRNPTVTYYLSELEEGRKEMFYLMTHLTHFIYGYMASDIW